MCARLVALLPPTDGTGSRQVPARTEGPLVESLLAQAVKSPSLSMSFAVVGSVPWARRTGPQYASILSTITVSLVVMFCPSPLCPAYLTADSRKLSAAKVAQVASPPR